MTDFTRLCTARCRDGRGPRRAAGAPPRRSRRRKALTGFKVRFFHRFQSKFAQVTFARARETRHGRAAVETRGRGGASVRVGIRIHRFTQFTGFTTASRASVTGETRHGRDAVGAAGRASDSRRGGVCVCAPSRAGAAGRAPDSRFESTGLRKRRTTKRCRLVFKRRITSTCTHGSRAPAVEARRSEQSAMI